MDVTFRLPYGRGTLPATIAEERIAAVLTPSFPDADARDADRCIREALQEPIDAPRLRQLAEGKQRIVVIVSDHTRPVPSRQILPPMLEELRAGNPEAHIALLVATGCHRVSTERELRQKLGDEIYEREEIAVHDCDDRDNLVYLGQMPSGQPLYVNRMAVEADLLVAEGFIEPHFFAGFSGGRKSVLPGIAGRETVLGNHCAEFIDSPFARTGILEGNPIHEDMEWAAKRAGLRFIVNVVLDPHKRVVAAFAGDPTGAHRQGCRFLRESCMVSAKLADIVVTTNGGYPLDQNLYQAVKGMTAAEALVREGGVIVMLAAAEDGCGGEYFYRQIVEADAQTQLARFRCRGRDQTEPDQWQTQIFLRVLSRAKVVLVTECPDEMVRDMKMIPARSVEEALAVAQNIVNKRDATITVVPDGVSVIAEGIR